MNCDSSIASRVHGTIPVRLWLRLIGFLLGPLVLGARDIPVQDNAQLGNALDHAAAGDVILMRNGTWRDTSVNARKGGKAGNPVTIRAETPGGVILGGSSTLVLQAPFVTVDGLVFYRGAIREGSVIQFNSSHGLVRNTAIIDYNPASFETRYYWVFFNGDNNIVDRCFFKGKNNLEPLIGNALEASRGNAVVRSYFKDIPYRDANGREDIRVWGTGKMEERDEDGAYFVIQANLFDHADGEGVEVISLKSNHNRVIGNTILATRGCVNIRRGSYNTVSGNIILGQGVPGAEGLRMAGAHNTVEGNYVSGCGYGIRVACGEYTSGALTNSYEPDVKREKASGGRGGRTPVVIPTYPQVRYLKLSGNILADNSDTDLEFGSDYKKHWPQSQQVLLPEDCVVENNRFIRRDGGVSIAGAVADKRPPLDRLAFRPNRFSGNVLLGGGNTYAPADSGAATGPLPAGWTEAGERAGLRPLSADDVGPQWLIDRRRAGDRSLDGK